MAGVWHSEDFSDLRLPSLAFRVVRQYMLYNIRAAESC